MLRDMQGGGSDGFVFMPRICATPRCVADEAHRDEAALDSGGGEEKDPLHHRSGNPSECGRPQYQEADKKPTQLPDVPSWLRGFVEEDENNGGYATVGEEEFNE